MLCQLILVVMTCTAGPDPQELPRSAQVQPRSAAIVASEIRAAIERLETGHASDFFADLARRSTEDPLGLSVSQAELVRQLDELVRESLRAWLLSGLDKQPPTGPEELSQRLGETGARLRRAVIAHAEAIALEGILTPRQAKRYRALLTKPGMPPLRGRYLLIPGIIPEDLHPLSRWCMPRGNHLPSSVPDDAGPDSFGALFGDP